MELHARPERNVQTMRTGGEGRESIDMYADDFATSFFIHRSGINPNSYSGFYMGQLQSLGIEQRLELAWQVTSYKYG